MNATSWPVIQGDSRYNSEKIQCHKTYHLMSSSSTEDMKKYIEILGFCLKRTCYCQIVAPKILVT